MVQLMHREWFYKSNLLFFFIIIFCASLQICRTLNYHVDVACAAIWLGDKIDHFQRLFLYLYLHL